MHDKNDVCRNLYRGLTLSYKEILKNYTTQKPKKY